MSSLRELQRGFMSAILDDPASAAASAAALPVVADGIAAAQRVAVYASNARANFHSALESSYPVLRRLVGVDYFEQCARGFQRRHPSHSGDLQPAGALFPDYIDDLHRDGEYPYLGDVARFEWLLQETLLAADHVPLDLGKLAGVAPADYERLRFRLHPSLRLFESAYPCLAIWRANSAAGEPPLIELNGAPHQRIAMVNSGRELRFHSVSEGEYAFLAALEARAPFDAAVDAGAAHAGAAHAGAAHGAAGDFDAAAALQRFVLAAAIVDFD